MMKPTTQSGIVAFLLAFGMIPSTLHSQQFRTVVGVATDSVSDAPIQKAVVCSLPRRGQSGLMRCDELNEQGEYRLDSLPSDSVTISLSCSVIAGLGKLLDRATIPPGTADPQIHNWRVSSQGCDLRPVRHLRGTFRGHYSGGFEESRFVPCPSDAWFEPGDSLDSYRYDARQAWVAWPKDTALGDSIMWPDVPRDRWGNVRYYIRWRGTVVGPGRYGHMGAAPFNFTPDSILEVMVPSQDDCR